MSVIFLSCSEAPPTLSGATTVTRSATDSVLTGQTKQGLPEYEYGWNDPPAVYPTPSYDTPNRPPASRTATAPGIYSMLFNIIVWEDLP